MQLSRIYRKLRRHQALHDGAHRHHAAGAAVAVVEDEGPGCSRHGNGRQGADWLAGGAAPRDGAGGPDAGTVWAHVGWKGSTPPEKNAHCSCFTRLHVVFGFSGGAVEGHRISGRQMLVSVVDSFFFAMLSMS